MDSARVGLCVWMPCRGIQRFIAHIWAGGSERDLVPWRTCRALTGMLANWDNRVTGKAGHGLLVATWM